MNDAMNEYLTLYYSSEDVCTRILCYGSCDTQTCGVRHCTISRQATRPHESARARAGATSACCSRHPCRMLRARARPTFARHGRSVHARVARSMPASLGTRPRRSAHARVARHTRASLGTCSRACSPHARMRGPHALDPLPCARPTLALGPQTRADPGSTGPCGRPRFSPMSKLVFSSLHLEA